jgi:hypothetical protein
MRLLTVAVAVCVFNALVFPAGVWAKELAPAPSDAKVTTVDPQFVPLSEAQSIEKPGVKWYWYLIGAVLIGGIAAAAGGGGGGGGSTSATPTTGTVSGTW